MRDVNRIPKFLDKFKELWFRLPDYRFWQVINILKIPEDKRNTDPFYWEEDEWIQILEDTINEIDFSKRNKDEQ